MRQKIFAHSNTGIANHKTQSRFSIEPCTFFNRKVYLSTFRCKLYGISKNIEPLLKQYCEESRLYLQHDINISRLAREIGINRLYLSQYFSSQGMNYNAYINDLRINHFICLYHEAVAAHRPVIAQQLAFESGYQSYSTFRDAFKRKKGQSVTAWMARQKIEV